jgi:lipopolysaccharide export LptBFGC system permease protein LptF
MFNPLDYPLLMLVVSLFTFWISSSIGAWLRKRTRNLKEDNRDDFKFVLGGTLTLLGLIIGFTFSMAVNRYDQRKNLEQQEANAIGTEYDRADFLPPTDAVKVRALLKSYLDQRMSDYTSHQIVAEADRLQTEMWSAVSTSAAARPSPLTALTVAGMNEVLDRQGDAQAARWNRIPIAAWALVIVMSIFSNVLMGYGALERSSLLFLVLPIALSMSLFLIAEIDSPGRGVIRVQPQNLERLAEFLHSR